MSDSKAINSPMTLPDPAHLRARLAEVKREASVLTAMLRVIERHRRECAAAAANRQQGVGR